MTELFSMLLMSTCIFFAHAYNIPYAYNNLYAYNDLHHIIQSLSTDSIAASCMTYTILKTHTYVIFGWIGKNCVIEFKWDIVEQTVPLLAR